MNDEAPPRGIRRPKISIKHRGQEPPYQRSARPLLKLTPIPRPSPAPYDWAKEEEEAIDSDPTPPSGTSRPDTPYWLSD